MVNRIEKKQELSFGYIKAEGIGNKCEQRFRQLVAQKGLMIILERNVFMSYEKIKLHQPILFFLDGSKNDIWKIQSAGRMIGSIVKTFIVSGVNAISDMTDIRNRIRAEFAIPCEFDAEHERSYPNFMHAPDDFEQVEQDIRILLPDMLNFCIQTNGSHLIQKSIW